MLLDKSPAVPPSSAAMAGRGPGARGAADAETNGTPPSDISSIVNKTPVMAPASESASSAAKPDLISDAAPEAEASPSTNATEVAVAGLALGLENGERRRSSLGRQGSGVPLVDVAEDDGSIPGM
jgi:hypothetical protein